MHERPTKAWRALRSKGQADAAFASLEDNGASASQAAMRLRTLLQLSQALNERLELPEILEQVVRATRDLVEVSDASILLWDERRELFETAASTTALGEGAAKRVRRSGGASRWIVDHVEPVVVSDTQADPFVANRILEENSLRAYVGVPLAREGRAEGVLYALHERPRGFDGGEMQLLQALAGIATVAVRNARQVQGLRRVSEFRETMMRLAAHDLRAPLSTMMAYLELLEGEMGSISEEGVEWMRQVWRSMAHMQRLIGDVLDYARLTDQGEIEGEPVDLNGIAAQVLASPEMKLEGDRHTIRMHSGREPTWVEGDPLLLREVIANLLGNSFAHTPKGTTIDLRVEPGPREHALIVRDDGPGIASGDHARSFEPFEKLGASGGTGLGLSLVRTIVERHGGRVTLDSAPGAGSTFTVWLPAMRTPWGGESRRGAPIG